VTSINALSSSTIYGLDYIRSSAEIKKPLADKITIMREIQSSLLCI